MNKGSFDLYSRYYDLLYEDKNYVEETDYIIRLLQEFDISDGRLLEYGSGTRKHGRMLGEAGFQVQGLSSAIRWFN